MEDTANPPQTQDTSPQQTPQQSAATSGPPNSEQKSKKKWIIVAIVLIVIVAIGGFLILSSPDFGGSDEPSPTPELEVLPTSTSTPTAEPADKSEITVIVLNGTGIAGEAGLLQTQLEDVGFVLIEVDNADDTDNEVTTVVFATDIPQELQEEVVDLLEGFYEEVDSSTSSSLDDSTIVITTGLRKNQTPKPTTAPTTEPEDEDEVTPTSTSASTPTPTPTSTG
jgi:hypothetical protein